LISLSGLVILFSTLAIAIKQYKENKKDQQENQNQNQNQNQQNPNYRQNQVEAANVQNNVHLQFNNLTQNMALVSVGQYIVKVAVLLKSNN
jgi:predicted histidine transporter YuiF (NhaC family)